MVEYTNDNMEREPKKLSAADTENIRLAQLYRSEYVASSMVGDPEATKTAEKVFRDAVNALSLEGRKALDDYFSRLPENERPDKIGLEY